MVYVPYGSVCVCVCVCVCAYMRACVYTKHMRKTKTMVQMFLVL